MPSHMFLHFSYLPIWRGGDFAHANTLKLIDWVLNQLNWSELKCLVTPSALRQTIYSWMHSRSRKYTISYLNRATDEALGPAMQKMVVKTRRNRRIQGFCGRIHIGLLTNYCKPPSEQEKTTDTLSGNLAQPIDGNLGPNCSAWAADDHLKAQLQCHDHF